VKHCGICRAEKDLGEYTYPGNRSVMVLCPTCAQNAGFCVGCGAFMAGSERDEHSGMIGLCYECVRELRDELGERDEYYGENG
jgi:hypothetical protein